MTNSPNIAEHAKDLMGEVIQSYKTRPVDLLSIGDLEGEYRYLTLHRDEYERTVQDVLGQFRNIDPNSISILEIGPFLGVVSIVLSRLGFRVVAADIKEFISCKNLQRKFDENGVAYRECNLKTYSLPFSDEEFDVVIMCETLEHLNFNPLPVIKEINRVLKQNGILYLSLPNLACLNNRLYLLEGKSIHNPIQDFFSQLDANANMIVGLHWREYTAPEVSEMLERMGFNILYHKYDSRKTAKRPGRTAKRIIRKVLHRIINIPFFKRVIYAALFEPDDPSLNDTQVTTSQKIRTCDEKFHFTDATLAG
jgi:2-polyprenyl-3-methyl-5-hydroxy-6-metoxy-1,4-benzoquinol methylase